jgi:ABC-type branched-subunit amino acid transport system ATPase component
MSAPLLAIHNASKHFGGISALNQVNFTVKSGRIKGLIGPNGAGKTTLFNLITGIYGLSSGDILFQNKSLIHMTPYQIARAGIARTFQNVQLFTNLSVRDNVMVGSHQQLKTGFVSAALNLPWTVKEEHVYQVQAQKLLQFVGLAEYASSRADALPFGRQRLLEIARSLATNPQLLLLDEPAAGLSTPERVSLLNLIREIRDLGITILLVEHDMDLVMKVCEEIVVLEFGSKIAEGAPEAVRNNGRVIAAYLGEG